MKVYAITISLIAIGLLLLYLGSRYDGVWASIWMTQIAATLLISGVVAVLDKALVAHDADKRLVSLLNIRESVIELGITRALRDSRQFDYSEMMATGPYFAVVLNDGRTWVASHIVQFIRRFNEGLATDVFILDPQNPAVGVLASKTEYSEEGIRDKIRQTSNRLIGEFNRSQRRGRLRIYHLSSYPTYSVFYTPAQSAISLYCTSAGRQEVPLLVFESTGRDSALHRYVEHDVNCLMKESKLSFDSGAEDSG